MIAVASAVINGSNEPAFVAAAESLLLMFASPTISRGSSSPSLVKTPEPAPSNSSNGCSALPNSSAMVSSVPEASSICANYSLGQLSCSISDRFDYLLQTHAIADHSDIAFVAL